MATRTNLPAPRDDEAKIIDFAMSLWVQAREMLAARYNQDKLIANLEAYVRRGRAETGRAIADAEAGDEFTNFVLRKVFADMIDAGEMPEASLRAYALKPPRKRKQNACRAATMPRCARLYGFIRTRLALQ